MLKVLSNPSLYLDAFILEMRLYIIDMFGCYNGGRYGIVKKQHFLKNHFMFQTYVKFSFASYLLLL